MNRSNRSAERVHAVHPGVSRLRSTAYRICLIFLTGYLVVFVLMIWGRISFLRDGTSHFFPYTHTVMEGSDNACVIGLATPACVNQIAFVNIPSNYLSHSSLSLLVYDLILNVLFTWYVISLSASIFSLISHFAASSCIPSTVLRTGSPLASEASLGALSSLLLLLSSHPP